MVVPPTCFSRGERATRTAQEGGEQRLTPPLVQLDTWNLGWENSAHVFNRKSQSLMA